ncbi:MAG TPA: hypothetical protein DDZ51_09310, partial [Planctomycetaceae bacterium]|nr:hypothetical protein [Planctomycetaceae bacterium]
MVRHQTRTDRYTLWYQPLLLAEIIQVLVDGTANWRRGNMEYGKASRYRVQHVFTHPFATVKTQIVPAVRTTPITSTAPSLCRSPLLCI